MQATEVISMFDRAPWLARHGDIVLVQDDTAELVGEELHGVIAGGSVAGHTHRLLGGGRVLGVKGASHRVIHAVEPGAVDHEEHATNPLPAGRIRTGVQMQFNPGGWGAVED